MPSAPNPNAIAAKASSDLPVRIGPVLPLLAVIVAVNRIGACENRR